MSFWRKNLIAGTGGLVFLYLLDAMASPDGLFGFGFDDYTARLLVFIAINVMLAASLNLINGFTGQFSIGHAGFMAVGAYSSAYMTVNYGKSIENAFAFLGAAGAESAVLIAAVAVAAASAAVTGLIVGIPSLRLKGDYLAIVTLGFAEIIRIVILNIDAVGGATGYQVPGYAGLFEIGLFAVLTVVVIHNVVRSNTGRTLVAIREDELAAEAMGIDTTRRKVMSFVIGSTFAGIAGMLFAHYNRFLSTNDFQFIRSFEIIIMIVVGGMGSMTGAVLGAVFVTLLPELLRELPEMEAAGTTFKFADLRLVIFALILILTVILRPQGIFGTGEFGFNRLARRKSAAGRAAGDETGATIAEPGKEGR